MYQLLSKILHESDDLWHMMDEHMMFWPLGGVWMGFFMMGYGLAVILLTVWTFQDAKLKDENATLWAIVVFFTMGIGVLVYGFIRQPKTPIMNKIDEESGTQKPTFIKDGAYCENCGKHLEIIDKFCDMCGTSV